MFELVAPYKPAGGQPQAMAKLTDGFLTSAPQNGINAVMKLQFNHENLGRFCDEHGIARLELFSSALRDDFRDDSDVDLLCTLRPDVKCGLFEWVALKFDFEKHFGRRVDLVSRNEIERSKNRHRKQAILSTAVPIYGE